MRIPAAAALALSLFVASFAAAPALAAPYASDIVGGFNASVNGNFQTAHDVEGPAVIGGNLSGSGTFMNLGIPLGINLAGFGSINVFGSAGTSSFNANGLAVKVGAANTGSSFPGAASTTYGATFPATRTEMWGKVTALSAGLGALNATSAPSALPAAGSNNAVLTATPATVNGIADVAVIDIAASLLGSYTGISVNPNGAGTVIINVTGNYAAAPNWQNGAAWRNKVIWNFENATSVALGATGIQGTVLAPFAAVSNGNPIEGGLFAASFNGGGELHYKPFTGSAPLLNAVTNVPEPASLALLATAAGGLALIRRRARRPAAR